MVNGVVEEDRVPYQNGDDILVIKNTGRPQPWPLIELTIEFDVPAPGACPLDLSQPQFDLVNQYHGEGLFFAPWIWIKDNSEAVQPWVDPADPRLLSVPADWIWPAERQAIWRVYPKVSAPSAADPEAGPIFVPLWWTP